MLRDGVYKIRKYVVLNGETHYVERQFHLHGNTEERFEDFRTRAEQSVERDLWTYLADQGLLNLQTHVEKVPW